MEEGNFAAVDTFGSTGRQALSFFAAFMDINLTHNLHNPGMHACNWQDDCRQGQCI